MRARRAFSLIELLVVITMIAVLISIILPALGGAIRRARSLRCEVSLSGNGTIFATWANDHRDLWYTVFARKPLATSVSLGYDQTGFGVTDPRQTDLWFGVAFPDRAEDRTTFTTRAAVDAISCPEVASPGDELVPEGISLDLNPYAVARHSYFYSVALVTSDDYWSWDLGTARVGSELDLTARRLVRVDDVVESSAKAVLAERGDFHGERRRGYEIAAVEDESRPNASFNVLFADGHVERVARDNAVGAVPVRGFGFEPTPWTSTTRDWRVPFFSTPNGFRGRDVHN